MITSNRIEKLAFEGKCRWSVFWFGYTSAGTIPCPDGGFVLLRQIMWNPFYQGETRPDQLLNTVHQLTLSEQGSRTELVYQWRDTVNQVGVTGGQHWVPGNGMTTVETWGVFKKNVAVDLLNVPDSGTAVYGAVANFDPNAQERQDPLGYQGIANIPNVQISGAENYFPTGELRPYLGVPFGGAGVRDRVRYNTTVGRQIQPVNVADPDRQYQFPLVGFGAWIFNIPVSEYLNY
jgi:hypothetical protein